MPRVRHLLATSDHAAVGLREPRGFGNLCRRPVSEAREDLLGEGLGVGMVVRLVPILGFLASSGHGG